MFERLIRTAPALLLGLLAVGTSAGTFDDVKTVPAAAGPAEIELRKSFRAVRRAGRQVSRPENRSETGGEPGLSQDADGNLTQQLGAVVEALGEQLQASGTLHLPDVDGAEIVLQGAQTPILQTAAGRHLIIDRNRTIAADVIDGLSRRWPGYAVIQPHAGANLREVIGSLLEAAGYDSVLRSTPLIFGRGVAIRITPDFVVLRNEDDLLAGETRAISVVDPTDAFPSELRELAGEQRVRFIELSPDGSPAGQDHPPWRDPAGRVTTVETARLAQIIEEIAAALRSQAVLPSPDEPAVKLNSAVELPDAIGALLARFSLPAIGPVVEFFREPSPDSPRRFVISVQGWLTESGARRLLITGAKVPPLIRLYLTREGIDIFEYRIRDGR